VLHIRRSIRDICSFGCYFLIFVHNVLTKFHLFIYFYMFYPVWYLIRFLRPKEIRNIIQEDLDRSKTPGYYLITWRILKEIPIKIVHLTTIYTSIIGTEYFWAQWKMARIVLIPKPSKPPEEVGSYRPISLPTKMNKIFEKITPDTRRNPNYPGPSVRISTATLNHIRTTPNYRDNKRNFK
jgi:hypothetical protein